MKAFHNDPAVKEKAAQSCVQAVRKYFLDRGFELNAERSPFANGKDLIVWRNGVCLTVEVKPARFSDRSWRVDPLSESGKNSDLIAIVFPFGRILIQPISEHRTLCAANGMRSLTQHAELLKMLSESK